MESRIQKTLDNHKKGYNCVQSVACAYCDLVGVDEVTMFKAGEAFGLGMGGAKTCCGAVSGAVLLAGFKNSDGNLEAPKTKASSYKLAKEITDAFLEKNGTLICRELKGADGKPMIRDCDGCIEDAAAIVEKLLFTE